MGALVGLLFFGGCGSKTTQGLMFSEVHQDLGTHRAGTTIEVRFPFEVQGDSALPLQLVPSCGCLNARLEIQGRVHPLGKRLVGGTQGSLVVDFATAGFSGPKSAEVEIFGEGPGFPQTLSFESVLTPWFTFTPTSLQFGLLTTENPQKARVVLEGKAPFRMNQVLGAPEGLEVHGFSGQRAARHELEIELTPGGTPGPRSAFLKFPADNGMAAMLPVTWDQGGDLWIRPGRVIPLGILQPGIAIQTTLDVGVSRGTLLRPDWRLEGIPGSSGDCLTLKDSTSYRLRLNLPGRNQLGPIHGEVILNLEHKIDGETHNVVRRVKLAGLVAQP